MSGTSQITIGIEGVAQLTRIATRIEKADERASSAERVRVVK